METPQTIDTILNRLDGKLQAIAWKYSWFAMDAITNEDIYQTVVLRLCEMALFDPSFLDKDDSYILTSARWIAANAARSCRVYGAYVQAEPKPETEDGNTLDWFDTIPGDIDPLEHYRNREFARELSAAIARLPQSQQIIVKDLCHEKSRKEIAAKLGISPSAVSQQVKTLRKNLAEFAAI